MTFDVEKYKTFYECDEHWELKRSFMEAHKERFPEEEVVCLAQVFTNIELLGCRYPPETMRLVAELSKELATKYRESRTTKLKRTFVAASDAAAARYAPKK
ncbi:partner of xrn-2 protein 1-like [Anopheles albimanus]|uniref:XRN2-binding (XTBD) domain-containing protein n=2 Tax=Nyssorhynchus TaxID=44543 RepID=A0A2M4C4D0_9DIPT|nr:partner of xrn-2 protein 1-like [Anopheles albimanus]